MKTLGLLGGMSWESTISYYRLINEFVKERLGGLHSAKLILRSLDFHEVQLLQKAGDWPAAGRLLGEAAAAGHFIIVFGFPTVVQFLPETPHGKVGVVSVSAGDVNVLQE